MMQIQNHERSRRWRDGDYRINPSQFSRDLLKRDKIIAAKTDTSVNALFNAELRHLVETFEAAEAHGNQNFQALLDFSLGRSDDRETMRRLP